MAARGHEVHVVTSRLQFPSGIDRSLPALETHENFIIHRLDVFLRAAPLYVSYPSNGGLILAGLQRVLKTIRPEVVHAHNIGAPAWALGGAWYARKVRAAFFYSPHFHSGRTKFDAVRKSLVRALNCIPLRTASKIYQLTSLACDIFPVEYRYAPTSRFAVLPSGVEPPADVRSSHGDGLRVNVLFVGRVDDARKGFSVLEAAVDELPHDVRRLFVLTVVGSISDATRQRLSHKYGSDVKILGPISEPDLEQAYADCDVFVMPSLYEGFGLPYIEAMRYGVPVIGSTAGGVPEVVPAGTGLLAAPGDSHAVAEALRRLVLEPELRSSMGAAGKIWSKRFYWDLIVDVLESDYRDAVQRVSTSGCLQPA